MASAHRRVVGRWTRARRHPHTRCSTAAACAPGETGEVFAMAPRKTPRHVAITLAAAALGASALWASGVAAATPIPAHVYAPYFETWTSDSINTIAGQSGARYFTLAFLETTGKTSCTLAWNGSKSQTVPAG